MIRIESLLSARIFHNPQWAGDRLYFISNLSGRLSLYAMNAGGSVPEPLLPPHIALQNPHLLGHPYHVFPQLGQIVVMIDQDGDENYQPKLIPIEGGYPEPSFNNFFANYRVHLGECDEENNLLYLSAESRQEGMNETFLGNLATGELIKLGASVYGAYPATHTADHREFILTDGYTVGDSVLFRRKLADPTQTVLFGVPLEERQEGQEVPLTGINAIVYAPSEKSLLLSSAIFEDTYSLGVLDIEHPEQVQPIEITGVRHQGSGELDYFDRIKGNLCLVGYNIDGCSWMYEGEYDEATRCLHLKHVLVGEGQLSNGTLDALYYDKVGDRYALTFSTATSPTQIYTIEGPNRDLLRRHTNERLLGLPQSWLSPGEDASFTSFDGTRISARLYLPSPELGFTGPRPVVYYVHGGPQGQERPDFAWFSMPLIQFLTLNGFAVFVPNVRGSTGYGLSYTKQVDHDWGGQDRLDHVHAMTKILLRDPRLDTQRAAVVGRSYGGYMTLTLAARHPELWAAAADMFGPYSLITFSDRLPPTWKPYFEIALGHPERDRDFLLERSPSTYIDQITAPLLVIQGAHDPRVVERESRDLVEHLRNLGKEVEYLMFENEGHDVIKYENKVTCYNTITEFFKKHLRP